VHEIGRPGLVDRRRHSQGLGPLANDALLRLKEVIFSNFKWSEECRAGRGGITGSAK
jgi:hypothetical protein